MHCSACGTQNRAGSRFCDNCGSPMETACPHCGGSNRSDARFCASCGQPLGGATDPSSSAFAIRGATDPSGGTSREAERRLVSVLFVDLVGFTTFAEDRDAEAV